MEKASDLYVPNGNRNNRSGGRNGWNGSAPDSDVDEEAGLINSSFQGCLVFGGAGLVAAIQPRSR
jgi:hypothetical protein